MSDVPPPPPPRGSHGTVPAASSQPPPPRSAGAQPAPRSKAPWIVAAVVLLLLAGAAAALWFLMGDGGESTPDLSESQLEGALLSAGDVGTGFTEDTDDGGELDADDLDASDECKELIGRFDATEEDNVTARREFQASSTGASVIHEITLPGEDGPEFDVLNDVVGDCGDIGFGDGTFLGEMQITEGDAVDVGERSFTMDANLEITDPQALTFELKVVMFERQGVISTVQVTSPFNGVVDEDLAISLSETADERLIELLDDAG